MRALVALGSNLGQRGAILRGALADLNRLSGCRVLRASRCVETAPEAPEDGGPFLNAAALLETVRTPREMLRGLLELERRWGRRRAGGRGGPRTLDLDLVLYGDLRLRTQGLEVPHPRFRGRSFVLLPAAQAAPGLRDPVTGRSLRRLRDHLIS